MLLHWQGLLFLPAVDPPDARADCTTYLARFVLLVSTFTALSSEVVPVALPIVSVKASASCFRSPSLTNLCGRGMNQFLCFYSYS